MVLGLSACSSGSATAAAPQPALVTAQVFAALRADMIVAIERDADHATNPCGRARALLSAARDASGDVARRLERRLRTQTAAALASGQPDCVVDAAARLVPLLPDSDKRALIGELAGLYERGLKAWGLYREVMPAIAPHLSVEEARRFADAVSARREPSCIRTIVLAHLADVGRIPSARAFVAMSETRDAHCLEVDDLNVLRFADGTTLRRLYPEEMALLDQPPATAAREYVRALALLAPYLEAKRRAPLLAGAFRVMPKTFVSAAGGSNPWGEIAPEGHFMFAMMRLAPLVDASLVDAALRAIPSAWSAESRALAAAMVLAALPAPLRRTRLPQVLSTLRRANPEVRASARLALAAELPPEDVREALEVAVKSQPIESMRAPLIAHVLRALPPPTQVAYADRVRRDVAAIGDADSRIHAAAQVLDALAGIPR